MNSQIVQANGGSGGALSKEHYRTFEVAKEHDGVLGGDNIAQIRSYAAYARAQAQAIHKTIAATNGIEDVAAIKQEALETEQTYAKVGLYADQRIGEILRELPKAKNQHDSLSSAQDKQTKTEAIQDAGITRSQAYDLQAMAANPEIVQLVIEKAEQDGRVVSRQQVINAINEQKRAERERDDARRDLASVQQASKYKDVEISSLKKQVADKPKPEVVEREVEREVVREVVPSDYEAMKQRVKRLEYDRKVQDDTDKLLRKQLKDAKSELDRARGILNLDETMREVQRDVQYLITSTNQYVRHYGGLTWTAQSLADVDKPTIEELRKAVRNLATFANTLMNYLEELNV